MTEFEKIASGIYLEGLAVDYQRNIVWYSDVIAGGVYGVMPGGSVESFNQERRWTGGIMLNEDGSVLSSGPGGIMWNNPETGKSGWLLHEIEGRVINGINEMVPDGTGGIYFGTIDIEAVEHGAAPGPSTIYRLTVDRKVIKLAEEINFSNGIMLSPDRKQFYCNDTFTGTWVFDVQSDLVLTNRKLMVDKDDVDGMAIDAQANIWITGFRSGYLIRVKPDGTLLTQVRTPAGAISQIRFGGPDMRDYYITAVPIDGGDNIKDGVALTEKNSFLYRGRSETPGMSIIPAQFKL